MKKMKRFISEFCFFETYGIWKRCYMYGEDAEAAMASFRADAVAVGITGGIYFRYHPVEG